MEELEPAVQNPPAAKGLKTPWRVSLEKEGKEANVTASASHSLFDLLWPMSPDFELGLTALVERGATYGQYHFMLGAFHLYGRL